MRILSLTTYALVIIGALNWGFAGVMGFDLVALIFGEMTIISRLIYALVGIAAIINLSITLSKCSFG
ncbi:MAG: DUF378 domain-containing protein [Bacillus subtilis]|nr:DUF378 domain-containing protein [Bacillus subtilis]